MKLDFVRRVLGRRSFLTSGMRSVVCLLGVFCGGCSKPTHGTVVGTILVDGAPPSSGSVAFFPTNGKSQTTGASIEAGKFTAKVALGSNKVEIRVAKEVGKKKIYDTPDSPIQTILEEALPAKYNDESELLMEVVPGENPVAYDLKTK